MKVTIASAQYPITQHADFNAWKIHTEKWVRNAVEQNADLLLFPEYGSMELVSIFPKNIQENIHLQISEMQNILGEFCETFISLAKKYNTIIVAPSFPVKIKGKYHNRAFVFSSKGNIGFQDKFFMTRFETEEWGIDSAPKKLSIFETEWGKFGIQICYDSEFQIGTHILAENGIDLLLVPSCTETIRGATRVHIGTRARSLEQQLYSAVSQTIGEALWSPAVDINYGYSGFYSTPDKNLPEEGIISLGIPQESTWHIETLDFKLNKNVRDDGQVLNFKDHQQLSSTFINERIEIERVKV